MVMFSAIPCAEEHPSYGEDASLEAWNASATLRCNWADRYALVTDIVGNSRPWPYIAGGPQAFSASIVPFASAPTAQLGQGMAYPHALVSVNYSMEAKNLISESIEPTAEFIKLDYKQFRWGAPNGELLLEAEAPGRLERGLNLVRTLYFVQGPLPTTLLSLVGHVNATAYHSQLLNLTFAPETLLYTPPVLSRTITTSYIEAWTITLKFMYKPKTWNKFWRQKSEAYEEIYRAAGTKYKNYPLGNFANFLY